MAIDFLFNKRTLPDERLLAYASALSLFIVTVLLSSDAFLTSDYCSSAGCLVHKNSKAHSVYSPAASLIKKSLPYGGLAKSFLIVFVGHSGSSAIMSELAAHSQIYFEQAEPVDHHEYQFNTSLALKWTRDFFERGIAAGKSPGFKIRPTHIFNNPKAWMKLAREYETRIIWQYRENNFKKAVGEYTFRYLNDSSVVEGLRRNISRSERCKIGIGCRFRIDNFSFFHFLLRDSIKSENMISAAVHMILGGRDCVHALPYEDYLYKRLDAMRRLQLFLGLKPENHKPLRYKATSDNLCEAVANWEDICTNFYGCHAWRWQMDDIRNGCRCEFKSGPGTYCSSV